MQARGGSVCFLIDDILNFILNANASPMRICEIDDINLSFKYEADLMDFWDGFRICDWKINGGNTAFF